MILCITLYPKMHVRIFTVLLKLFTFEIRSLHSVDDALITHCPLTTMPSIKENTIMCSGIKIYVHVLTICKLIFPMAMGFYSTHVRT